MKIEWVILIISAVTDFIITSGTAITTAMVATGSAQVPNDAVLLLSLIGGLVAAARTIQQKLNATPETVASLRGNPPPRPPAPLVQPVVIQQPKTQPVPVQEQPIAQQKPQTVVPPKPAAPVIPPKPAGK